MPLYIYCRFKIKIVVSIKLRHSLDTSGVAPLRRDRHTFFYEPNLTAEQDKAKNYFRPTAKLPKDGTQRQRGETAAFALTRLQIAAVFFASALSVCVSSRSSLFGRLSLAQASRK